MNDNEIKKTQALEEDYAKADNGFEQNAPYPNSGTPYPNSGTPYPNSGTPYPQSGMPYPQSGMPYPQSGMPYPQSGMPYPQSVMPEEKSSKTLQMVIIAIVAVVVIALATTLVVVLRRPGPMGPPMGPMGDMMPPPPPPGMDMMDYSNYSQYEREVRKLVIDGQEITLPQKMLSINDLSYISVQDFANVFGYNTVFDMRNKQTTVSNGKKEVIFSNGINSAIVIEDGNNGEMPLLDKPLMFSNNQTYVPLRSMKSVFNFESIDWNEADQSVEIKTDGVTVPVSTVIEQTEANVVNAPPGGPGGPPPDMQGGQPPQGGQGGPPPDMQGGQPPQGGPGGPPQN